MNIKPLKLDDEWLAGRSWDLPTNLYSLRFVLGENGVLADPARMEKFMKSPAAEPMPNRLRAEVEKWINSNKNK